MPPRAGESSARAPAGQTAHNSSEISERRGDPFLCNRVPKGKLLKLLLPHVLPN